MISQKDTEKGGITVAKRKRLMKGNGKMERSMAKEKQILEMVPNTLENSKRVCTMAKGSCTGIMGTFMKADGKTAVDADEES